MDRSDIGIIVYVLISLLLVTGLIHLFFHQGLLKTIEAQIPWLEETEPEYATSPEPQPPAIPEQESKESFWAPLVENLPVSIAFMALGIGLTLLTKRAIEKREILQLLDWAVVESSQRERQAYRQSIHGGVQQWVTHFKRLVKRLEDRPELPPEVVADLKEGSVILSEEIEDLFEGPDLSREKVDRQLERTIQRLEAAGIYVSRGVEGEPRPLPTHLYCELSLVIQEVLNNVQKHAGDWAEVFWKTSYEEDRLVVDIMDTGRGFDPAEIQEGSGFPEMRERVRRIGGQLKIASHKGQRTFVTIVVPLDRLDRRRAN